MHRGAVCKTIVAGLGLAIAISACSRSAENIETSAGPDISDSTGNAEVDSSIAEIDGAAEFTVAEPSSETTETSTDSGNLEPASTIRFLDTRDGEFATNDLAPLSPTFAELGPGWDQFQATVFDTLPVIDRVTGAQDPRCGIETFLYNGVLIDYGHEGTLGDGGLLVSRGTQAQNRQTYDALTTTFACPADEADNGVAYTLDPVRPALPGAIASSRFQINDALGRRSEGILVLRPDLVMMLNVLIPTDPPVDATTPPPTDVTALVSKLLTSYDTTNAATAPADDTDL